ncbi:NfeD family protein [Treponema sp.]
MKSILRAKSTRRYLGLFLLTMLSSFPLSAQTKTASSKSASADSSNAAWIIPINGDIAPTLGVFVRREATRALEAGAAYIIFEIDTFGGRVDTALQISSFIGSLKGVKTIAWIHSGPESMGVSWSAGALIALSCSEIYMANGTSIGAAAPVTIGADGQSEATGEKTVSAVRSQMAALAEKNGHPTSIALAMVDQDVELWEIEVAGEKRLANLSELERLEKQRPDDITRINLVSAQGKLLSLTAGESLRLGLAQGLADDEESLLKILGADPEVTKLTPGFADSIVALLSSAPVQALLILLGLVMLFLEINSPGFGIPGAVAIIAFIGVFGTNALLGTVGSLELILFLIGVGLLAVELFVLPGFGIAGISGILLIGSSLVFSMQDFVVPDLAWQWELMGRNLIVVAIGLIAAVTGIALIALAGPRIKLFDRLTLKTSITGTAGGPDLDSSESPIAKPPLVLDEIDYSSLKGKKGQAATTLRPSGKAFIDGTEYVVEGDGSFIELGTDIEVVRVRGNRIVVRKVGKSS